jgi:cytochrome c-type biogenesis protein CcmH
MIVLWLIGGALALGVLAWVLRPLLFSASSGRLSRSAVNVSVYRDQLRELEGDLAAGTLAREDYERARAELERRLLEDVSKPDPAVAPASGRGTALAVAIGIPILAAALYFTVGNPAAVNREAELQASAAQVEAMVARLAMRLREKPDDVEGWKLLGRSYAVMGRFAESAEAYGKAAMHAPRDAQLLADFADSLAMARGQRLEGEPEKLVLRALEIDPNNLKALALAGTSAYERKDYGRAAALWQRMLAHVPPESEEARSIQQNVNQARSLVSQNPSTLKGTVSLSPKLKDKAAPEDTVFVFARAVEGPPMPLAVARVRVRDLPYRFQLDDSMAMSPALKLSTFPKVVVTARISKTGTATPQAGDLQGASAPVPNDASAVSVVIDGFVR